MLEKINISNYKTNLARHYVEKLNELISEMSNERTDRRLAGGYFYGNRVSDYAIENGYLDYGTLAKSFDVVLCNNIAKYGLIPVNGECVELWSDFKWQLDNIRADISCDISADTELYDVLSAADAIGEYIQDNSDYCNADVSQFFIISDRGAEILKRWTNELVWLVPVLDVYVWGVRHYGTSWDYVLTDIKLSSGCEEV